MTQKPFVPSIGLQLCRAGGNVRRDDNTAGGNAVFLFTLFSCCCRVESEASQRLSDEDP